MTDDSPEPAPDLNILDILKNAIEYAAEYHVPPSPSGAIVMLRVPDAISIYDLTRRQDAEIEKLKSGLNTAVSILWDYAERTDLPAKIDRVIVNLINLSTTDEERRAIAEEMHEAFPCDDTGIEY